MSRLLFILYFFLLACEQGMEITAENTYEDPNAISNQLSVVSDGELVNGSPFVEGVQYYNSVWLMLSKHSMNVSLMDLDGTDLSDPSNLSDFGDVSFMDTTLFDDQNYYSLYLDITNRITYVDRTSPISMLSENSITYHDFNYSFNNSIDDFYDNVIEITNLEYQQPHDMDDDIKFVLNQHLSPRGGSIRIIYEFITDKGWIDPFGQNNTWGSGTIYLRPRQARSDYKVTADVVKELFGLAVERYNKWLTRRFGITEKFDKGRLTRLQISVSQRDFDYDKITLVERNSQNTKELDVIISSYETVMLDIDDYEFDFSGQED